MSKAHKISHQLVANSVCSQLTKSAIVAQLNKCHRQDQIERSKQLVFVVKALWLLSQQNIPIRGTTFTKVWQNTIDEVMFDTLYIIMFIKM
jgi:hypothetical protein